MTAEELWKKSGLKGEYEGTLTSSSEVAQYPQGTGAATGSPLAKPEDLLAFALTDMVMERATESTQTPMPRFWHHHI